MVNGVNESSHRSVEMNVIYHRTASVHISSSDIVRHLFYGTFISLMNSFNHTFKHTFNHTFNHTFWNRKVFLWIHSSLSWVSLWFEVILALILQSNNMGMTKRDLVQPGYHIPPRPNKCSRSFIAFLASVLSHEFETCTPCLINFSTHTLSFPFNLLGLSNR